MFFFATMKAHFEFPQYRRLVNGKSWYFIHADDHMVEYQVLGSKLLEHEVKATIMPERWAIADVLQCANSSWEPASEMEFTAFLAQFGRTK
jgi:hypothetical protein